jgi:hypothetical protein
MMPSISTNGRKRRSFAAFCSHLAKPLRRAVLPALALVALAAVVGPSARAETHVQPLSQTESVSQPLSSSASQTQALSQPVSQVQPLSQAQAQTQVTSLRPGGTPTSGGLLLLSGSFHDHSTDSDGDSSSKTIVAWEFRHRYELGLDFAGLSDHADFWPFAYRVPFGGSAWRRQAKLAKQYARDGFSFVRSFEYTSDQENHVSVIGSPMYLGGMHRGDLTMTPLYHWLALRESDIAQFNHPGTKGALQWDNLAFVPSVAGNFATIEIHGDQGFTSSDLASSDAGWYWLALTRGWTVGPTMNWDTHHWRKVLRQTDLGVRCGELPRTLPCQRTLVLADAATPEGIMRALHARRTTATEHPSLWATLRGPGGIWQGSTVNNAGAGQTLTLTVEAGSSLWPLERVDIVSDNGIDPHAYYDGDNPAHLRHSGPVADSFLEQHRRFERSGGYAVRKATIDGPPPNTTVASFPLSGNHATQTILVTIPNVPSLRPDRKHFYYAVVSAGLVRAWTAPIFTDDGGTKP